MNILMYDTVLVNHYNNAASLLHGTACENYYVANTVSSCSPLFVAVHVVRRFFIPLAVFLNNS